MSFKLLATDKKTKARAGILKTPHGEVQTPVFMPVATQASVKAISQEDLATLGVKAILANSYHLYLRPGTAVIRAAGGLHRFMGFDGMILTDSGGFQVLSMSDLRKVNDDGVTFRSHINGSTHVLTPQKIIEIQSELGSDCWTTLDECPPFPSDEKQARQALERTMKWTDLSVPAFQRFKDNGHSPLLFPILQGSFYPELRRRAAEHMTTVPHDGVSLGGFSVGEPKDLTWSTLDHTTNLLAQDKPRYLMGVGIPEDLWDAVALGVDMMDCVWPTRVARNGQVLTRFGKFNITNSAYRQDFDPIDKDCRCFVCGKYSRAYLGHLFRARELLVHQLISYHNLYLMAEIMSLIRKAILTGAFEESRKAYLQTYRNNAAMPA
ncbi:MAG: tRNA guanosine(34) transglycosylase Tgt [Elusimicrobia bacterium RIFCSPHIGHO2_02_FULL_57_9]|nr:MAG: tRNA guanosine(34) transglycosylase Tgt [Elusimicrobia bacterium RIFCSPHIGHO2_02_FULL_57_9]